jgi:predicted hydrocarbon binding protein
MNGQRNSNDIFVRLNPKTNQLEREPDEVFSNLRVMIIDEQFYKGLRNKLYERFQSGASVILYDMGLGYGEIMGKGIAAIGISKIGTYKRFLDIGKKQGYGEFQVPLLKMILAGLKGEAYVNLKDSFFATSVGRTGQVECFLVAGMIAGAARFMLNKDVECIEVKCISKGDELCQFNLKEKKKTELSETPLA